MPKAKFHAKCSRCGYTASGNTKGDVLNAIRKHMWKNHAEFMRRRIKRGLQASKTPHAPGNPFGETLRKILNPKWTGFAERPVIEKLTGRPYEQVREEAVDAFVAQLFDGLKK